MRPIKFLQSLFTNEPVKTETKKQLLHWKCGHCGHEDIEEYTREIYPFSTASYCLINEISRRYPGYSIPNYCKKCDGDTLQTIVKTKRLY